MVLKCVQVSRGVVFDPSANSTPHNIFFDLSATYLSIRLSLSASMFQVVVVTHISPLFSIICIIARVLCCIVCDVSLVFSWTDFSLQLQPEFQ